MSLVLENVRGLAELEAAFKLLPDRIATKILRRGVAAGAAVIKRAAIADAPVGNSRKGHVAGTLKRAAIVKFLANDSNAQQVEYIVTFRQGKGQQSKQRDAFYARFVEFGHKIVPRTSKAGNLHDFLRNQRTLRARRQTPSGQVPPHRFLGPAFDSNSAAALDTMIRVMESGIAKEFP